MPGRRVVAFEAAAEEQLRVIRQAMERSGTFTAVPGAGGAAMGGVGLVAAWVASIQPTPGRWLAVWLGAAVVAASLGVAAMARKAARSGTRLWGPHARRFWWGLAAPLVAGAGITLALWQSGAWQVMPPAWMLLYGAATLAGGTFSVSPVRAMGTGFMVMGGLAVVTPPGWGNLWLAGSFGVLQLAFGLYIARHHGG